jgi:hypothetical protein
MIFFIVLVATLFLALVGQTFIPPLPWFEGARVMLLPIVFFYGALAMPFWAMLILAWIAGFMWDALNVQIVDGSVEIALGWSIVFYAFFGAIMNGFRPLFQRGRWEIHCILSGLFTSLLVGSEYLMLTLRRGDFVFSKLIGWRIGGAGIAALFLAPFVFFILNYVATLVGYDPHPRKPTTEV